MTDNRLRLTFQNTIISEEPDSVAFDLGPFNQEGWSEANIIVRDANGGIEKISPIWLFRDDLIHLSRKLGAAIEGRGCDFEPMEPAYAMEFQPVDGKLRLDLRVDTAFIGGGVATEVGVAYSLLVEMGDAVENLRMLDLWMD